MATTREDVKDKSGKLVQADVEVETYDPVPVNDVTVFGEYYGSANQSKEERATARANAFANLNAAVDAGHVKKVVQTIEFVQKTPDKKIAKIFRQDVTQFVAKNKAGALVLPAIESNESTIWDAVSEYSFRNAKQSTYIRLRNRSEGPEKAIAKINKLLGDLSPEQRENALKELGLA